MRSRGAEVQRVEAVIACNIQIGCLSLEMRKVVYSGRWEGRVHSVPAETGLGVARVIVGRCKSRVESLTLKPVLYLMKRSWL